MENCLQTKWPMSCDSLLPKRHFLSETTTAEWLVRRTDLMIPPGHGQTVGDGQPVPVHLEVCGMAETHKQQQINNMLICRQTYT